MLMYYSFTQGNKGLILVRTQTLVIAATYTESMLPSVCVEAVERLGKWHDLLCYAITYMSCAKLADIMLGIYSVNSLGWNGYVRKAFVKIV